MPGNFRTRAHSEKWDMAFDSKMPCLVLKSLDGHETGRQATDLDENFGTPYSFSRKFKKIAVPRPASDFQATKISFHFFVDVSVKPTVPLNFDANPPPKN